MFLDSKIDFDEHVKGIFDKTIALISKLGKEFFSETNSSTNLKILAKVFICSFQQKLGS